MRCKKLRLENLTNYVKWVDITQSNRILICFDKTAETHLHPLLHVHLCTYKPRKATIVIRAPSILNSAI